MRAATTVALAACGSGVFIEVDSTQIPEGVDRIEIITSKKHCHLPFNPDVRCDHMQGEGFPRAFGDDNSIFTRHLTGNVAVDADGLAVFELEPGFGVLPMVFAIARDGQGTPIGVAAMEGTIDSDAGAIVYHVKLDPAQPFFTFRDDAVAGVNEWGVNGARDCIGVEPIHPDPDRGKVFIVPDDNPDCDSRSDLGECDPLWFHGYNPDIESGQHCVVPSPHLAETGPAPPCVLGHVPSCSDLDEDLNVLCLEQREPFSVCVPSVLCGLLDGVCPTTRDAVCLETALAGSGPNGLIEPNIICKPPGMTAGIELVPCPNALMIIPRPVELGTAECKSVKLTNAMPPFHAEGEDSAMLDFARFDILDFDNCNVVLKWSGSGEEGRAMTDVLVYELFVDGEVRRMLVPIVFSPENSCGPSPGPPDECIFATINPPSVVPDSMFQCAI